MKIAVPIANGRLSLHFGHADEFALITIDPREKKIVEKKMVVAPPHEPGLLPRWLGEEGAQVIIAGGMGVRAQTLFAEQKIEVVIGAMGGTPEEVVTAWMDGTLKSGPNPCDH
jgi:ATP-binding protein involved in chromosome partitioning